MLAAGLVYVATVDRHVLAVDAVTGDTAWTFATGVPISGWIEHVEDYFFDHREVNTPLAIGDGLLSSLINRAVLALG